MNNSTDKAQISYVQLNSESPNEKADRLTVPNDFELHEKLAPPGVTGHR